MLEPRIGSVVTGGAVPLIASSNVTAGLNLIEFHTKQKGIIGSGGVGSDISKWSMKWDTFRYADGEYDLFARSVYNSGTNYFQVCDSPPIRVKIANGATTTSQSSLIVDLNTTYWEGPTNIWVNFFAKAYIHSSDGKNTEVSATSAFEWSTSVGVIEPAHDKAVFKSGPKTGEGVVKVKANYNNMFAEAKVNIKIYNSSDYSSYPTSMTSDDSSDAEDNTDTSSTIQNEPVNFDPKLAECLKNAVGDEKYNDFISGTIKPTIDELNKAWSCFAQSKYVVPVNWSPVNPDQVKKLPRDNSKVKITAVKNQKTKSNDGEDREAIVLEGKTLPNSNILLYVFSEPLVLAVTSDKDGNWSYQLENPLEPGEHEAYVALNTGEENYVSSDPIVFEIARAESSDQNPNGASLLLSNNQPYGQSNYIYYSLALVFVALVFVYIFVRKRKMVVVNNVN
jgi:hypothetical protein